MLVIESGNIVAGAASYISAADATTFHTARGNTLWTGADSVKEAALLRAAAYLDGHYRGRWLGNRVAPVTQCMEWPRYGVSLGTASNVVGGLYYGGEPINNFLLSTTIPQRLKGAQCELALMELTTPGILSPTYQPAIASEKLDVIETSYKAGASAGQVEYPAIDQLLSDYLTPKGTGRVLRG